MPSDAQSISLEQSDPPDSRNCAVNQISQEKEVSLPGDQAITRSNSSDSVRQEDRDEKSAAKTAPIVKEAGQHRNHHQLREKAKSLRRSGMVQSEIAKQLGLSQPTVSRLLSSTSNMLPRDAKKLSFKFNLKPVLDSVFNAIALGGAIAGKPSLRHTFDKLEEIEVLRKSTVPTYYVLTDEAIGKLARGRQYNFIRFCLFDVLHLDNLGRDEFEAKINQVREMWLLRKR